MKYKINDIVYIKDWNTKQLVARTIIDIWRVFPMSGHDHEGLRYELNRIVAVNDGTFAGYRRSEIAQDGLLKRINYYQPAEYHMFVGKDDE